VVNEANQSKDVTASLKTALGNHASARREEHCVKSEGVRKLPVCRFLSNDADMSSAKPSMFWACSLSLFACGFAEALIVYIWNPWTAADPISLVLVAVIRVVYALTTFALIVSFARAAKPISSQPRIAWAVTGCGFILSVSISQWVLAAWPNSGDEYGYNYLADTLMHGRLWNPSVPPEMRDLLDTSYIGDRDGKRVSQYPPGWPAVLAAFKFVYLPQFANALIGVLACAFIWLSLCRLKVPSGICLGVFILASLAPFTVFQNASYFNHSLTAACLGAIIWLDLRDTDTPSPWNRAGIGFAFSILLSTRYEAFLLASSLFTIDALIRKRLNIIRWGAPAVIAGLPGALLLLAYNWRITGNPFLTTLAWASPNIAFGLHANGIDGPHSLSRGIAHTIGWAMSWQDFASVLLFPLYMIAIWQRSATGTLRWFDLILPAVVVFFVFYPDYGGFQYGPRYWYFGYVGMAITIAAGVPFKGGLWKLGRWLLDPMRLGLLQLASFAGFMLGYAIFLHLQTEVRLTPLRVAATVPPPALVLVPEDVRLRSLLWQKNPPHHLVGYDYTRNGLDGFGPVILGVDLGNDRLASICGLWPGRHIFRLSLESPPPRGHLEQVCTGGN
jgi:hypothetical protein